jgi:D-alanyl-D-alanine carboxypeptidase (penicillin-binding protein 5/6)
MVNQFILLNEFSFREVLMKRYFAFFLSIFIILISLYLPVDTAKAASLENNADWPEGPKVYAEAAIIMDASTGLILYNKNMDETHYPASITKIMTSLLAIENSNLGEIVTFSRNAIFDVDPKSSRIGIDVGEQLTMQQCLYAILLASDNQAAYAVAEHISGSIENFADLMNKKAKELGCTNTHFSNPNGLHDDDHYTTCHDMALITQAAMKNETFRKIFGTRTYTIPPTNIQSESRPLANHHDFILRQGYLYNDCIGGKTGYTSKARYTLVSVAKRNDLELICVVMRDDSNQHQYTDTQALFDFAFDNFQTYPVADLESTQIINESPMFTRFNPLLSKSASPIEIDGKGYVVLPVTASFSAANKEVTFYSSSSKDNSLNKAPADPVTGKVIGKISYTYDGKYVGGADILYKQINTLQLVQKEANKSNPTDVPEQVTPEKSATNLRPIILGSIVGLFAFIAILYFVLVERPRLKRRNAYYRKRARRRYYRDDDFLDL